MDLKVPGALPTMLCRPPTINGTREALLNEAEIKAMPGVDATSASSRARTMESPGGVAVAAKTFGQCIDAIRTMKVALGARARSRTARPRPSRRRGPQGRRAARCRRRRPAKWSRSEFVFHFRPGDPLETNTAVADVARTQGRDLGRSRTRSGPSSGSPPILGLAETRSRSTSSQGGGSFGRRLFSDAAFEAALASKMLGKPGEADVAPGRQAAAGPGASR